MVYLLPNILCSINSELQSISDWVKDTDETIFITWSSLILRLKNDGKFQALLSTDVEDMKTSLFFWFLFFTLYLNYDLKQDFTAQFELNIHMLNSFLDDRNVVNLKTT